MSIFKLRLASLKFSRFFATERPFVSKSVSPLHIKQQENLIINRLLETNQHIDNAKWAEIRKDLFNSNLPFTEHNVDRAIVDFCCTFSNELAVKNYIQFLRNINHEINIATMGKYFRVLYNSTTPLSAEDTKLVFELYDNLRAKYSILDTRTAECCIFILSKTSRWRECLDLMEMIESPNRSGTIAYGLIITAAFDNDDANTGWECLKSMQPRMILSNSLLESYLNYCIRHSANSREFEILITKMFKFWSDYDFYPELSMIEKYSNALKNTKEWIIRETAIKHNGTCDECGHQLSNLQISKEDFDHLSKSFLTKVLVGDDVYNNTTPGELRSFKKFVNATKPYDVVIDGLNVAYSLNSKGSHNHALELAKVVKTFVSQNKKIFILGRKHMHNWSENEMNYIKKNSYMFLANNTSEDDPFMLYATFTSGMNTYFTSRDFMRQHKFILHDENLRRIFRHWQLTRQIVPIYVGVPHNKQLLLVYPPEFLPIAQQSRNGDWHIPCNENISNKELQVSNRPKKWLCFKKINNKK